jgi:Suppressor of fused protein (SUFU)
MTTEMTPGGSRIVRHSRDIEASREMSHGDRDLLLAMERHLDHSFGSGERRVFHELFSPTVHVDVHVIPPSAAFPLVRLVTCGMAERPMTVPSEFSYSPYAELTIALPPDWPIRKMTRKRRAGWPLQVLQELARFPHQHSTYLWDAHTIPWGEPFATGTRLSNLIVLPPEQAPDGFDTFECRGNTVNILGLIALHDDELESCLNEGVDALCERLEAAGVTDVVDPRRESVA